MATTLPIPEPAAGLFVRDDDEGLFSRDGQGNLIRLDDPSEADYNKIITLQIDGQTVQVPLAKPLTDANGNLVLDLNDRTTPRYTTIYDAAVSLTSRKSATNPRSPFPFSAITAYEARRGLPALHRAESTARNAASAPPSANSSPPASIRSSREWKSSP